jgi:hypothetical protein
MNSPSQSLSVPSELGSVPSGKEKRQGPGKTSMSMEGEHGVGTGDRATKFTPDPRAKQGDSPAL